MWCKMWQESRRGGNHGSRAGTPLPRPRGSPLADPPAVKELLRAEVKMLLQTLRERVTKGGRWVTDPTHLNILYCTLLVNYWIGWGFFLSLFDVLAEKHNGVTFISTCKAVLLMPVIIITIGI